MAEGARLESVFTRKGNVGSNPTLSAILLKIKELREFKGTHSQGLFSSFESVTCSFAGPSCVPLRLNRLLNRFIQADFSGSYRVSVSALAKMH